MKGREREFAVENVSPLSLRHFSSNHETRKWQQINNNPAKPHRQHKNVNTTTRGTPQTT